MENNQKKFIEYVKDFAYENKVHIWLGGSFLRGNASSFSDVDISVLGDSSLVEKLIYGYGKPVYLSHTSNPKGILIVIYEDGVAVDLDVIKSVTVPDNEFFHEESIKKYDFVRDETISEKMALQEEVPYQMARLFHRSMIKYLAGKKELGISVANEIAAYMGSEEVFDESNYKSQMLHTLKRYNEHYKLPEEYLNLLLELTDELTKTELTV